MLEFADQAGSCRMVRLVRHFGDRDDDQPCGICDVCAPDTATMRRKRRINAAESRLALQILEALGRREGQTVRQLHERWAEGRKDRQSFERFLEGLAGAGLIEMREDAFSRDDGKVIAFRRAYLTEAGRKAGIGAVGAVRLTATTTKAAPARKRSKPPTRSQPD